MVTVGMRVEYRFGAAAVRQHVARGSREIDEDATVKKNARKPAVPELRIMASSEEAGVFCAMTARGKQVYVMGHSEYDADTLKNEYLRDKNAGLPIQPPAHYFPDDDPAKDPIVRWRSCANLFYSNWLNYYVYQTTPYDIKDIQ